MKGRMREMNHKESGGQYIRASRGNNWLITPAREASRPVPWDISCGLGQPLCPGTFPVSWDISCGLEHLGLDILCGLGHLSWDILCGLGHSVFSGTSKLRYLVWPGTSFELGYPV